MLARPPWQIHGEEQAAAIARLEDLPSQSRRRYRIDGHVRGTDDFISAAIRASDPAACSAGAPVAGGDHPSERPMDRAATERSLRMEASAAIPHSRSRCRLW